MTEAARTGLSLLTPEGEASPRVVEVLQTVSVPAITAMGLELASLAIGGIDLEITRGATAPASQS